MSIYKGTTPLAGIATPHLDTRNIGQIIQATMPLSDAGLHLLDGSLLTSGSYSAFITYMASMYVSNPELFDTEANWQASVSAYGVCGKFVYDSVNSTVRLPKIVGFVEGASGTATLGDVVEAGLPNITGTLGSNQSGTGGTSQYADGAFYAEAGAARRTQSDATGEYIKMDASLSSAIYGNSTTVQPQSVKVLYYIVIANSTKTEIEVDIDEIATDLNGKADVDLSNVSNTSGFRKLVEVYNNGTSWCKVYREYDPSDGTYIGLWCEQGGIFTGTFSTNNQFFLLKPYGNTDYIVITNSIRPDGTSSVCYVANTRTSTYFSGEAFRGSNGGLQIGTLFWRAEGYLS